MKYGIDIHGVLTQPNYRQFILPLMEAWVANGEDVLILSGPPLRQIKQELADLGLEIGVHYTEVFSIVDYLKLHGVEMEERTPDHWWTDPETWNSTKGKIAREQMINVVVDDSPEYAAAMPSFTTFILIEQFAEDPLYIGEGERTVIGHDEREVEEDDLLH